VKEDATKGKFAFTTEDYDMFEVCFESKSPMGECFTHPHTSPTDAFDKTLWTWLPYGQLKVIFAVIAIVSTCNICNRDTVKLSVTKIKF